MGETKPEAVTPPSENESECHNTDRFEFTLLNVGLMQAIILKRGQQRIMNRSVYTELLSLKDS